MGQDQMGRYKFPVDYVIFGDELVNNDKHSRGVVINAPS